MVEYIEKAALLKAMVTSDEIENLFQVGIAAAKAIVNSAPVADVALVVHGRWLPEHHKDKVSQTEYHSYIWYHCSECGRRLIGYRDPREAPYCHCGAKMDLRGEDNDGTEKA